MPVYPSMKANEMFALLSGLGYKVVKQRGSHKKLKAEGRPQLTFAFHDGAEIAPGLVRKILLKDVQLDEAEAGELLGLRG